MYENYLAENIKFFREKEGVTLAKLSYKSEVTRNILSNIEDKRTLDPSMIMVVSIAKAMKVCVEDLVNKDFRKEGICYVDNEISNKVEDWKYSKNINAFIQSRHLKSADVGRLFNITSSTVGKIRNEKKISSRVFQMQRIAKAMNVTIDELLFEKLKFERID